MYQDSFIVLQPYIVISKTFKTKFLSLVVFLKKLRNYIFRVGSIDPVTKTALSLTINSNRKI